VATAPCLNISNRQQQLAWIYSTSNSSTKGGED
jgi:hypothetical protein